MTKVCDKRLADIIRCFHGCGDKSDEVEEPCFCNHTTGKDGWPVNIVCYEGDAKDQASCKGSVTGQGSLEKSAWVHIEVVSGGICSIKVCTGNCLPGGTIPNPFPWEDALFHEMMHCCGAPHDPRNEGVTANPDKLEACLRPIAGFSGTIKWGHLLAGDE